MRVLCCNGSGNNFALCLVCMMCSNEFGVWILNRNAYSDWTQGLKTSFYSLLHLILIMQLHEHAACDVVAWSLQLSCLCLWECIVFFTFLSNASLSEKVTAQPVNAHEASVYCEIQNMRVGLGAWAGTEVQLCFLLPVRGGDTLPSWTNADKYCKSP